MKPSAILWIACLSSIVAASAGFVSASPLQGTLSLVAALLTGVAAVQRRKYESQLGYAKSELKE